MSHEDKKHTYGASVEQSCRSLHLILGGTRSERRHIPKCRSTPLRQWFLSRLDLTSLMTHCVNIQVIFEEAAECSPPRYICETHVPSSTVHTEPALSAPSVWERLTPPENKPLLTTKAWHIQLSGRIYGKMKKWVYTRVMKVGRVSRSTQGSMSSLQTV